MTHEKVSFGIYTQKTFFPFAVLFFIRIQLQFAQSARWGIYRNCNQKKNLKKEQINKQNEEKMNKQRRITNGKFFSLPSGEKHIQKMVKSTKHTEWNTFLEGYM